MQTEGARSVRDGRAAAARVTWGAIEAHRLSHHERRLIASGLGGVVLFSRNVESASQLARLTGEIHEASPGRRILISMDQEGGHISRLPVTATRFPSAMAIGATRSARLAFESARASGRELAAAGVDVVLAPVVDLAADPWAAVVGARSFGSSPALVARLGAAAVRGYLAGGVVPTPKHFPGHGRTPLDSHLTLPIVDGSLDELESRDLPPFRAVVDAAAPVLMTAHVTYSALRDRLPATLSRGALRGLARRSLGFDGVLLTDALVMDAIARNTTLAAACVAALRSGADVVMSLEPMGRAIEAIENALDDGRLAQGMIARTLGRIERLEDLAERQRAAGRSLAPGVLAGHAELAGEVARRSLTLLWDAGGLLPLNRSISVALVELSTRRASPIESPAAGTSAQTSELGQALGRTFGRLRTVVVRPHDRQAARAALSAAAGAEVVILATRDAFLGAEERELLAAVGAAGRPVIRIALRSPVDLVLRPLPATAIAAYADVPATCGALADALGRGASAFPGRLPMSLPAPEPELEPDLTPDERTDEAAQEEAA